MFERLASQTGSFDSGLPPQLWHLPQFTLRLNVVLGPECWREVLVIRGS